MNMKADCIADTPEIQSAVLRNDESRASTQEQLIAITSSIMHQPDDPNCCTRPALKEMG
jgi:hypothetical protein